MCKIFFQKKHDIFEQTRFLKDETKFLVWTTSHFNPTLWTEAVLRREPEGAMGPPEGGYYNLGGAQNTFRRLKNYKFN